MKKKNKCIKVDNKKPCHTQDDKICILNVIEMSKAIVKKKCMQNYKKKRTKQSERRNRMTTRIV